jgi:hypothetical protein
MDGLSIVSTPGITFLLTLVFGFWLSIAGKPYNGILFNIHKLIALGTVILTAMQVYNSLKTTQLQPLLIAMIIVAALCVLALFASGAFLSTGYLDYRVMKTVHRVALVLGFVSMVVMMYLLSSTSFTP